MGSVRFGSVRFRCEEGVAVWFPREGVAGVYAYEAARSYIKPPPTPQLHPSYLWTMAPADERTPTQSTRRLGTRIGLRGSQSIEPSAYSNNAFASATGSYV